jgi:signal transduction histidine kinase
MAEDGARPPRLRRASLRLRITLLTALVVAVAVALGGALILKALDSELRGAADDVGKERALEITGLAEAGRLPATLPEMEDPETPAVVVSSGRVVTATPGFQDPGGFGLPERAADDVTVVGVSRLPVDRPGPYRVVARGVRTPTGPATVYVAVPIHDVEHTLSAATRIGGIGLLLLIGVLTAVMWLAIGRALAPVNAIRVRADAISGQSLDLRVPTPARQDEIGRLARTVNQMLGRLQASADSQRRFVADAAHELRSPIASLRMQLETVGARDRTAERARVDDMLHETARMEALVDQLLLLARAGADASWLRLATVDLDDIVDSGLGSLGATEVAIDRSAVEPVQLVGDAGMLEQVVCNLAQNAVAHARTTVRVSLTEADGLAVLTVDDDGPGVPTERRADIFERFVRLDDSRDRVRGGVGLGLAIVSEIVVAHGGRIHVADSPWGGARFVVELPVTRAGAAGTR